MAHWNPYYLVERLGDIFETFFVLHDQRLQHFKNIFHVLCRAELQLQLHAEARFRYSREFALSRFPDDLCAEASTAPTTHPIASTDYRKETAFLFFLCVLFRPSKGYVP